MGIVKGQHYQLLINFSTGMTKVIKPIKEVWDEIKKDKNAPIELIQKENDSGIVRVKRLKPRRRIKRVGTK